MLPPKHKEAHVVEDELICLLLWMGFLALPRQLASESGVAVVGPGSSYGLSHPNGRDAVAQYHVLQSVQKGKGFECAVTGTGRVNTGRQQNRSGVCSV